MSVCEPLKEFIFDIKIFAIRKRSLQMEPVFMIFIILRKIQRLINQINEQIKFKSESNYFLCFQSDQMNLRREIHF